MMVITITNTVLASWASRLPCGPWRLRIASCANDNRALDKTTVKLRVPLELLFSATGQARVSTGDDNENESELDHPGRASLHDREYFGVGPTTDRHQVQPRRGERCAEGQGG